LNLALRSIRHCLPRGFERLIRGNEITQKDGENYKHSADGKPGSFFFLVRHGNSFQKLFKDAVKIADKSDGALKEL
jgi:hypothetical protein